VRLRSYIWHISKALSRSDRLGPNEYIKSSTPPWERDGWLEYGEGLIFAQRVKPLATYDETMRALKTAERARIKQYNPALSNEAPAEKRDIKNGSPNSVERFAEGCARVPRHPDKLFSPFDLAAISRALERKRAYADDHLLRATIFTFRIEPERVQELAPSAIAHAAPRPAVRTSDAFFSFTPTLAAGRSRTRCSAMRTPA
jgi:hypothetical protein